MSKKIRFDSKPIALSTSGEPPTRVPLFGFGVTETSHGPVLVDDQSLTKVMEAFTLANTAKLPIDIDHMSMDERVGKSLDERKSYGWFSIEANADEGLVAVDIDWTPSGAGLIKNKEFRHWSPVVFMDTDGRVTEVVNMALTNSPATKKQPQLIAGKNVPQRKITKMKKKQSPAKSLLEFNKKYAKQLEVINKYDLKFEEPAEGEEEMPDVDMKAMLAELIDVVNTLEKRVSDQEAVIAELKGKEGEASGDEEVVDEALSVENTELKAKVEELSLKVDGAVVKQMVADKKLIPAIANKIMQMSADQRAMILNDEDTKVTFEEDVKKMTKVFKKLEVPNEVDTDDIYSRKTVIPFSNKKKVAKK